jgi:hypothetical protein
MMLPPILVYLASYFAISAGLYTIFSRVDDVSNAPLKAKFAAAIYSQSRSNVGSRWPTFFNAMFDDTFGHRHLTIKCFLRSCLASLYFIWILFALWSVVDPRGLAGLTAMFSDWQDLLLVLMIPIVINFIPDYLSLLKSRAILRKLSTVRSAWILVATDVAASIAISITALDVGVTLLASLEDGRWQPELFTEVWPTVSEAAAFHATRGSFPIGVLFYSTLLTSVWAVLFLLGGIVLRASKTTAAMLVKHSTYKEKPFSSVGMITVVIVTAIYLMIAPLVLLT